MDARKTPRTKTSFQVTLTSKASGVEQTRVVEDISQSGFFVSSLGTSKIDDLYLIEIKKPGQSNSLQLVARATIKGAGCHSIIFNSMKASSCLS